MSLEKQKIIKPVFFIFFMLLFANMQSQNYTVYGYVKDTETGNTISDVSCFVMSSELWTESDANGFYSIKLTDKQAVLQFSRTGYKTLVLPLDFQKDSLINIELSLSSEIDEIIVIVDQSPIHKQTLSGKIQLSQEKIKNIPSIGGVPDIIKAISYLPGVSGGKDGFSNLYVRGGGRDQNLVLIDNINLSNTNHFPGFVSMLNSSIVEEIDVYKGGFPSRYGGKLSSVIDIKTKTGNTKKTRGNFNIGVLYSDFLLDTPLRNKKTTVLLAGRTTYYNLFSLKSKRNFNQLNTASYIDFTFFDTNLKIAHKFNERNKINISAITSHDFYSSNDKVSVSDTKKHEKFGYNQHNTGVSINHNFIINPEILFKQHLVFAGYTINNFFFNKSIIDSDTSNTETAIYSTVNNAFYKFSFDMYHFSKHDIKLGGELGMHHIGADFQTKLKNDTDINSNLIRAKSKTTAYESSFFLEDGIKFSKNFNINAGLRFNLFRADTFFLSVEPRVSARLLLHENISLKAAYTHTTQFQHMITNNMQGIGREFWVAASDLHPPESAKQVSWGIFGNIKQYNIEIGTELFFKRMKNLIHYKFVESQTIFNIENNLINKGEGKAYGLELLLQKRSDKYEFSLSYTYAKSFRKFSELNNGNQFPHIYDKEHDISCLLNFIIKEKNNLGLNFIFNTGTPISLPSGYVKGDDLFYGYYAYSGINNMRLPDYHRLDLSYTREWKTSKNRKSFFSVNIFNVYARKNAVYIYFDEDKVKQKSFFTILPSVNFGIKFL